MKKLGWLHATPEGRKQSRAKALRESNAEDRALLLPDVGDGSYIVAMLHEAGLASTNGMGPVVLSWQEIEAWLRVTENTPGLWEKLLVKELSEAYVAELSQATDFNRPDPYVHIDEIEVDRDVVQDKLKGFFSSRKKAKKPTKR